MLNTLLRTTLFVTLFIALGFSGHGSFPIPMACQPAFADQAKDDADRAAEIKIGKQSEAEILKTLKVLKDPVAKARVDTIVAKLALVATSQKIPAGFGNDRVFQFPYHVTIIDDKTINAFSLPGGSLYIYRGLLDLLKSDDEVACILGHEMAHAAHHHVAQLIHEQNQLNTQLGIGLLAAVLAQVPLDDLGAIAMTGQYAQIAKLNNHFSEKAEEDADHTGMIYALKAGYNPIGMLTALKRLKDVEDRSPDVDMGFLQDHPLTPDRIDAAHKELAVLGYKVDSQSLWRVSGSMRAKVVNVDGGAGPAIRLDFGQRRIAIMSASHLQAAQDAASALDDLVEHNGQGYLVTSRDNGLYVSGRLIVQFDDDDVKVQILKTTPEELAKTSADIIKDALWEVAVRGISAQ